MRYDEATETKKPPRCWNTEAASPNKNQSRFKKERTTYPGAERYAAFAAYEAEQKAHPVIISVKDIAKSAWER